MLRRALILDLEVSLSGRIHEVGAVFGGDTYSWSRKGREWECHEHLAAMAAKADLVLGHNLRRHDLADSQGVPVVRFSSRGWDLWGPRVGRWREIRVVALLARTADMDADKERRAAYQVSDWEVPVLEMVLEDSR